MSKDPGTVLAAVAAGVIGVGAVAAVVVVVDLLGQKSKENSAIATTYGKGNVVKLGSVLGATVDGTFDNDLDTLIINNNGELSAVVVTYSFVEKPEVIELADVGLDVIFAVSPNLPNQVVEQFGPDVREQVDAARPLVTHPNQNQR